MSDEPQAIGESLAHLALASTAALSLSQAMEGVLVVEDRPDVVQGLSALAESTEPAPRDPAVQEALTQRCQALAAASGPRHNRFTFSICVVLVGVGCAQAYGALMVRSGILLLAACTTLAIAAIVWRKSHWLQFNLRSVLAAMVLLSFPMAWVGSVYRCYHDESAAVKVLASDWQGGCSHSYDHLPVWFQKACPADWLVVFGRVVAVDIDDNNFGDEQIAILDSFRALELVNLSYTNVTDEGVAHLTRHRQLHSVWLRGTHITRRALFSLDELPELAKVDAIDTAITRPDVRKFQARCPKVKVATSIRVTQPQSRRRILAVPGEAAMVFDGADIEAERVLNDVIQRTSEKRPTAGEDPIFELEDEDAAMDE